MGDEDMGGKWDGWEALDVLSMIGNFVYVDWFAI